MKKTDIAYFAGIFDGEGCIIIHKSKPSKPQYNPSYTVAIRLRWLYWYTKEWVIRTKDSLAMGIATEKSDNLLGVIIAIS